MAYANAKYTVLGCKGFKWRKNKYLYLFFATGANFFVLEFQFGEKTSLNMIFA